MQSGGYTPGRGIMSTAYRYRSLFRSAEYRFEEDGVSVTERHFGRFARALVPYDHIPVHSTTITLAIPNEEAARYLIYLCESGLVDENGYTRLKDFLARLDPNESIGFR